LLANPQNLDISELLDVAPSVSPFADALKVASHVVVVPNSTVAVYTKVFLMPARAEKNKARHAFCRWLLTPVVLGVAVGLCLSLLPVAQTEEFRQNAGRALAFTTVCNAFGVMLTALWPHLCLKPMLLQLFDAGLLFAYAVVGSSYFIASFKASPTLETDMQSGLGPFVLRCLLVISVVVLNLGIVSQNVVCMLEDENLKLQVERLHFESVRHAICSSEQDSDRIWREISGAEEDVDAAIQILVKAGAYTKSLSRQFQEGFGAGVKMPPAEGVTLEGIQQLLAQQSATIMEAQRATIDQLEARQNEKLQNLEKRIVAQSHVSKDLGTAIKDLEDRMAKVEHASRQPMGSGGQQDPKKLSVALCNFQPRDRESASETRSRMMAVISAVNGAQAQLVGGEKPLWCSFSRTPEERGRASVPGFVKKVIMTYKPGAKDDLDLEYSSGMSWMDEAQLSGVGVAPSGDGVVKVETRAGPGWVDIKQLASKAGVAKEVVGQMVRDHRQELWVGSVYIKPDCNQAEHERRVEDHLSTSTGCTDQLSQAERQVVELDQQEITRLAKEYTAPRFSKQPEDWNRAFAERRKERKKHYEEQVKAVAQGEWSGYKHLRKQVGDWECHFAESQEGEPHKTIHDHLEGIYGQTGPGLTDFQPEGEFRPISPEELQEAVRQGKKGKSVGEDGTSLELLESIMMADGGESALLTWFNQILETAEIPDNWYTALMIILPKTARPVTPKQLRPICLSSSVSKVFCRILLARAKPEMRPIGSTQCAGPGKQAIDYIHALHKLFSLEREWKFGLCFLKVDLEKAFDLVSKPSLMKYIKSKIGKSFEARCWQRLLNKSEAHLHTAWGDSTLQLNNGIRQGAVESPLFFTNLAEWTLEETARRYSWPREDALLRGLKITELMFVDDATLWQSSLPALAKRVEQWMTVLRESGGKMTVHGFELVGDNRLNIMGLNFAVQQTTCDILSALLARARDKFWGCFHLLGSRAPLHGRLKMLERVCGGAGLWCIAAFYPEKTAQHMVNSFQLQLVVYMMKLKRGTGEDWLTHRKRVYRAAREVLWRGTHKRWSTLWAERFWLYQGHVARGVHTAPPLACSLLSYFRDNTWWKAEQQNPHGERHRGQFYARLTIDENDMDAVAGGAWREKAQLRDEWRGADLFVVYFTKRNNEWFPFDTGILPGGTELSPEWMETVRILEKGIYEAAATRVRNYARAEAAAVRRRELLLSRQPTQTSAQPSGGTDRTSPHRENHVRKRTRPDNDSQQAEECSEADGGELVTMVATSSDTSRTPRRTGRSRPLVTESTVWLTPRGALHEAPSTTTHPDEGPTTTDEAMELWLELLGFTEAPGNSLPTVIPESIQSTIQETIQAMTPRAVGLMRRSLPLCLNSVQDEVLELVRASSQATSRPSEVGRASSSTSGRDASGRAPAPPSTCTEAGREVEEVREEHTGGATNAGEADTVEVVVEDGDSDSSYWLQVGMWQRAEGVGIEDVSQDMDDLYLVQVGMEIEDSSSSSGSSSSTSSSQRTGQEAPDAEQAVWNKHHGAGDREMSTQGYAGEDVRRLTWWRILTQQLKGDAGQSLVDRKVWKQAAEMVQARGDENYSIFANVLMDVLGEHVSMEIEPDREVNQVTLDVIKDIAARLWHAYEARLMEAPARPSRRQGWRTNNKPSWAPTPWARWQRSGSKGANTGAAASEIPVEMLSNGEEALEEDEEASNLMQKTLTSMMNQQGRTRVVLQGMNFRLSNVEKRSASRRARAILTRLVLRSGISSGTRFGLHELVQDAEATLAGHVEDGPPDIESTDEDVQFVRGWWEDLLSALEHDLHAAPPLPLHCLTAREQQEIERDMEEDREQTKAELEWEEYMQRQENKPNLGAEGETPDRLTAQQYRAWEDWAMWDEMNGAQKGHRKRKLHVQVRTGGMASSSSCSTSSCDLRGWDGKSELSITLRMDPVDIGGHSEVDGDQEQLPLNAEPAVIATDIPPSEVSTVEVPEQAEGHQPVSTATYRPPCEASAVEVPGPAEEQQHGGVAPTVLESDQAEPNIDSMETLPWGHSGLGDLSDGDLAAIDAYAARLREEYAEMEGGTSMGANFEDFLTARAEAVLQRTNELADTREVKGLLAKGVDLVVVTFLREKGVDITRAGYADIYIRLFQGFEIWLTTALICGDRALHFRHHVCLLIALVSPILLLRCYRQ
ncbi:unnamed protein product, partial [Symbiodinium sp. KB8]